MSIRELFLIYFGTFNPQFPEYNLAKQPTLYIWIVGLLRLQIQKFLGNYRITQKMFFLGGMDMH